MHLVSYDGSHSLLINGKSTWEDYGLIPSSRPVINPAEPKTEYVDIPGADGSLDYSDVLAGIKYKDRTGSWDFIVAPGYDNWIDVLNRIINDIHGKKCTVVLTDEPKYYYEGRLSVNEWKSEEKNSTITINYVLNPYKLPYKGTGGGTIDPGGTITPGEEIDIEAYEWKWDDLFANTIYYGRFNVENSKYRTLINDTNKSIPIATTCSSQMTLTIGEDTIILPDGTTQNAFVIEPGNTEVLFEGNGQVILDYNIGRIL